MSLRNPFVLFLSSLISVVVALGALELALNVIGQPSTSSMEWSLDAANYSLKYIFWSKSYCQESDVKCNGGINEYVTSQIYRYDLDGYQSVASPSENCTNILFLGDSFTDAPFSPIYDDSTSYPYGHYFVQNFVSSANTCVNLLRLAGGGTGTDQQFQRFYDSISVLQPDIVIWQFYNNDYYDNVRFALFDREGKELSSQEKLTNTTLLTGLLMQKIPVLQQLTIGKYILAFTDRKDLLHQQPFGFNQYSTELIPYNNRKVAALLERMSKLAQQHEFAWYTTLAPLECEVADHTRCSDNLQLKDINHNLRQLLSTHSTFISMDGITASNSAILGASTEYQRYFDQTEPNVGDRHLSREGQQFFGNILFASYTKTTK